VLLLNECLLLLLLLLLFISLLTQSRKFWIHPCISEHMKNDDTFKETEMQARKTNLLEDSQPYL